MFNETFWVAISIVLICVIIYKYAKIPMVSFLNERSATISNKITEALFLLAEADKMLKDQKELHKKYTKQTKDLITSAKIEVALLQQRAEDEFMYKFNHKTLILENNIHENEAKLLRKLRVKAVQLAVLSCAEIIQSKGTDKMKSKLRDEAIKEIAIKLAA